MRRGIYKGRIVDLAVEQVTLPNGATVDLEIVHHVGAAAVVAADAQDRVVLIHQYRHAAGGFIWELPAGVLESADEPPERCAARELREEVGLVAARLDRLGTMFTTPGFSDERIHLFLARGLTEEAHDPEPDEVIQEIRAVPVAEAVGMVRSGAIVDGKTIAGLFLAEAAMREGR